MGIDVLDITFRVEQRFGITLEIVDWESVAGSRRSYDITAGELQFLIGANLRGAGRPVPAGLWHGVQLILAQALGKPPKQINPGTWLIKELGMS